MTTTINASPTNGLVQTADGSGVLKVQSNGVTTNALAWVNFNGGSGNTAGVINASYNVSSVTVNGTGDYTVNLTNTLTNANYVVAGMSDWSVTGNIAALRSLNLTTSNFGIRSVYATATLFNPAIVAAAVFGN